MPQPITPFINITCDNKGNVNVDSNVLQNKLIACGLLRVADHLILNGGSIRETPDGPEKSNIVPATTDQMPPSPVFDGKKR